ncbi:hypothetical protein ACIBRY_19160 [Streptomyces anulatus]
MGVNAGRGLSEPEHTLGRILVPLLGLRRRLRADGAYDLADEGREAVAAGGVRLHDTAEGSEWWRAEKTDDQQTGSRSGHMDPSMPICALAYPSQ